MDWGRRGLGFRFGDRLVNLLGFADDLVLAASSFLPAQQMVVELLQTLQQAGLCMSLEPGKICWANSGGEVPKVTFVVESFEIPWVEEFDELLWALDHHVRSGHSCSSTPHRIGLEGFLPASSGVAMLGRCPTTSATASSAYGDSDYALGYGVSFPDGIGVGSLGVRSHLHGG